MVPFPPNDDHPDQAEPSPSGTILLVQLARAADLCLPPYRHAVRSKGEGPGQAPVQAVDWSDCCLWLEARDADGLRQPHGDLELEIYRSGQSFNLTLSRLQDPDAPLLWHGSHPVWMCAASGERCDRPADGAPLEAFCRRVRALLTGE